MFRLQFRTLVSDAKAGMSAIREAASNLRQSRRLRHVLATILAAGNALNSGTARGNAKALKLETLLKLADVKAVGGAGVRAKPAPNGKENGEPAEAGDSPPGPPLYISRLRSLLDYVAWVTCTQQGADDADNSKPADADAGASQKYLAPELPALGEAVRRMQTGAFLSGGYREGGGSAGCL